MSEPTYSFTLTESERAAFAKVLGAFVTKLLNAPPQVEDSPLKAYYVGAEMSATLPLNSPTRPADSPPAVAQSEAANPVALRDRWARDRNGNEAPNPKGKYALTVRIWKTERRDLGSGQPRLKVTFGVDPSARGFTDANCFDEKLFPWIAAQSKESTALLYVVKSGKYLNIVGVRA
jgi:hypothetical protein